MTLGEIKENLEQAADNDRTLALIGTAHQNAKETLVDRKPSRPGPAGLAAVEGDVCAASGLPAVEVFVAAEAQPPIIRRPASVVTVNTEERLVSARACVI